MVSSETSLLISPIKKKQLNMFVNKIEIKISKNFNFDECLNFKIFQHIFFNCGGLMCFFKTLKKKVS